MALSEVQRPQIQYDFRPEFREHFIFSESSDRRMYDGRGMAIIVKSLSDQPNLLNSDEYPLGKGVFVGKLKYIAPGGSEILPYHKERDKHILLTDLTEFFTHVDEQHKPSYLYVHNTNFRMARFFARWMGGDMSIADPAEVPTPYDYAVGADIAQANLFSSTTQAEIERLAPLRDIYDEMFAKRFPENANVEPRLPQNDPRLRSQAFRAFPKGAQELFLRKRL